MSALSVHYTTTPKQVSPPRRKRAIPLRPHTFRVDNAVYDHYGKILGAIGFAVYCAFARYANRITGECWPAVDTIAEELDLSPPTVTKHRNFIAELGLLTFTERFGPSGRQTTHLYTLHTVDELEGRGKAVLPQDPAPRGKTVLPLSEQGDLTSRGASTGQEKTYTRRILEHSMDALKAVEQERQENDARQAKIRALDETTRQALEAEAWAVILSDPTMKREFVQRSHLELVMHDIHQAQQQSSEEPAPEEVPQEIPQEVPEELPQDVPEELPQQVPEELPQEVPEESPPTGAACELTDSALRAREEVPDDRSYLRDPEGRAVGALPGDNPGAGGGRVAGRRGDRPAPHARDRRRHPGHRPLRRDPRPAGGADGGDAGPHEAGIEPGQRVAGGGGEAPGDRPPTAPRAEAPPESPQSAAAGPPTDPAPPLGHTLSDRDPLDEASATPEVVVVPHRPAEA